MIGKLQNSRHINQRNFVFALGGIALAVIVGFFIYEFKFLRAPELEVIIPERDVVSSSDIFDVKGRADPDADLTLNGRPLYSGGTGEFEERVYLVKGVNHLKFEAKNRYGKSAKVTRYIVVK
mgnify:CR=1 FL=1